MDRKYIIIYSFVHLSCTQAGNPPIRPQLAAVSKITKNCDLLLHHCGSVVSYYTTRKNFIHSFCHKYIRITLEENVLIIPTFVFESLQ